MPVTNVGSRWSSGDLIFYEKNISLGTIGNIMTIGDDAVTVGSATNDIDLKVFLGSASNYALFDVGNESVTLVGSSSTEERHFLDASYTATGKNIFGWYLSISQTYATDGAPRGLTIRTSLDHTSGHTVQGANAIDARVTLGDTNTGIAGEMHAMESHLKIDEDTRTVNGTFAAHKFTTYIKDGNTMPSTSTFFLRFYDANGASVACPLFADFSGITAGASNSIEEDSGAVGTVYGYIRVKCPDSSIGYVPIYASHS